MRSYLLKLLGFHQGGLRVLSAGLDLHRRHVVCLPVEAGWTPPRGRIDHDAAAIAFHAGGSCRSGASRWLRADQHGVRRPVTNPATGFGGIGAPGLADPNVPLFGGKVTKSASRAYPISGGTLTVTRDGKTAVAADPDRGRVFLADLATKSVRSVVLDENDEAGPGGRRRSGHRLRRRSARDPSSASTWPPEPRSASRFAVHHAALLTTRRRPKFT